MAIGSWLPRVARSLGSKAIRGNIRQSAGLIGRVIIKIIGALNRAGKGGQSSSAQPSPNAAIHFKNLRRSGFDSPRIGRLEKTPEYAIERRGAVFPS
jgi:hypothetical protein